MFDITSLALSSGPRLTPFSYLAMVKVRRVYVVTSNPERVPEFQRLLQLYGIEVCHASPFGYRTKRDGPQALLPLAETLGTCRKHIWMELGISHTYIYINIKLYI